MATRADRADVNMWFSATDDTKEAFKAVHANMQNLASSAAILEGPLGQVAGRINAVGAALTRISPVGLASTVSIAALTAAAYQGVAAAAEYERQLFKLDKMVELTGHAAGFTSGKLEAMARELSGSTTVSISEAREATGRLLALQEVTGDRFKRTMTLAADYTAVLGGQFADNATKIGKALANPKEALGELNGAVLAASEAWRKNVADMAAAGKEAEAQELILKRLEERIGGASGGEAAGLAGAVVHLKDNWVDLLVNIANKYGLVDGVTNLFERMANAAKSMSNAFASGGKEMDSLLTNRMVLYAALQKAQERGSQAEVKGLERALADNQRAIVAYENRGKAEEAAAAKAGKAVEDKRRREKAAEAERLRMEDLVKAKQQEANQAADEHNRRIDSLRSAYEGMYLAMLGPEARAAEQYRRDANNVVELWREAANENVFSTEEMHAALIAREEQYQGELKTIREKGQAKDDKNQEQWESKLESLREGLLTEEQEIDYSWERRAEIIQVGLEKQYIAESTAQVLMLQAAKAHGDAMLKLEMLQRRNRLSNLNAGFNDMMKVTQGRNKGLFEAFKAANMASTIISTYTAATAALAPPPTGLGPIAGIPLAFATVAAGLANLATISSTSYDGGGSAGGARGASSAGGGSIGTTPEIAPSAPPERQQTVNIYVEGSLVDFTQLAREMRTYNVELEKRDTI